LCELKELQIRDGLHVFGLSPCSDQLNSLLLAIARARRGNTDADESLLRALAADLELGCDPLTLDFSQPWTDRRPKFLGGAAAWRSAGDMVERARRPRAAADLGRGQA
jgi:cobaltochelatase CobN